MATSVRSESLEALPRMLVTPTHKQILGNTCLITKTIVYEHVGVRNCSYLRFTEVFAFYDSAFTTLQSTRVARVSRSVLHLPSKMLLRYYRGEDGTRVYTLKKIDPNTGNQTLSAHPARFTPTDQHSKERIRIKERFGLLPTQKPAPVY